MAFELEDLFLPPSDDEQTYASLLAASPHPVDVNRRPADLVADGHPADKVTNQLRCSVRERSAAAPAQAMRPGHQSLAPRGELSTSCPNQTARRGCHKERTNVGDESTARTGC